MGFNFPNSPTPGQVYEAPGGPTYSYSSGQWTQTGASVIPPTLHGAQVFDNMAQATASVIPSSLNAVFLAGYYTPGDFGGALYKKVATEPTHGFQSADGAWWAIAEKVFTPQMFGAKGDGVHDDYPALRKALDWLWKDPPAWDYYPAGPSIYFPFGHYYMGSVGIHGLQLKAGTHLTGDNTAIPNAFQHAAIVFPPDKPGIVICAAGRIDSGVVEPALTRSAQGTTIRHLFIYGGGGSNQAAHGITVNTNCTIEHTMVNNFGGNGVHVYAAAPTYGNANCFNFYKVSCYGNGLSGIYLQGPDANAGLGNVCDCTNNGRWGIWDNSFLGNTWVGCHTAGNGLAGSGQNDATSSSVVHYAGNRYAANVNATEAQLVATVPGTNDAIWRLHSAGGGHPVYPTWLPAQPEGTYFVAGSYLGSSINAVALFVGCYSEGDQAVAHVTFPGMVVGGNMGNDGTGGLLTSRGAAGRFGANLKYANPGTAGSWIDFAEVAYDLMTWHGDTDHGLGVCTRWFPASGIYGMQWANTSMYVSYTAGGNTLTAGRTAPLPPGKVVFNSGMILCGEGGGLGRHVGVATVAPTTGEHAVGEIVFNESAAAGGKVGWVCTAAGTPGTWKAFGAIDP